MQLQRAAVTVLSSLRLHDTGYALGEGHDGEHGRQPEGLGQDGGIGPAGYDLRYAGSRQ